MNTSEIIKSFESKWNIPVIFWLRQLVCAERRDAKRRSSPNDVTAADDVIDFPTFESERRKKLNHGQRHQPDDNPSSHDRR